MRALLLTLALAVAACNTAAPDNAGAGAGAGTGTGAGAVTKLGSAIDPAATQVALGDVAKKPDAFAGKTFTTTGTITSVCQHMGCWMEIKDDAGEAHVKMAGHAFFIPKTASGRRARVLATLEPEGAAPSCNEEGAGCGAEDKEQKLALIARGVELL